LFGNGFSYFFYGINICVESLTPALSKERAGVRLSTFLYFNINTNFYQVKEA